MLGDKQSIGFLPARDFVLIRDRELVLLLFLGERLVLVLLFLR